MKNHRRTSACQPERRRFAQWIENWWGTTKKKNCPHQLTIKFTPFLPINFLPLPAPPKWFGRVVPGQWKIGPMRNQNLILWPLANDLWKFDEGQQKNKNCSHQLTIKFTTFLPINFLPLPAPPQWLGWRQDNGNRSCQEFLEGQLGPSYRNCMENSHLPIFRNLFVS